MFRTLLKFLSDADGGFSSKRLMMFLFGLVFIGIIISNHITGKNLDDTLKWQLFAVLVWLISVVYGEKIPDIVSAMKGWVNAGGS